MMGLSLIDGAKADMLPAELRCRNVSGVSGRDDYDGRRVHRP